MGRDSNGTRSNVRECPVCGKTFWCSDAGRWAYRAHKRDRGKGIPLCSWHCQVEYNHAMEEEKRKRRTMNGTKKSRAWHENNASEWCWLGNLQQLMEKKGVTAKGLADAVNKSASAVCGYKLCKTRCRRDVADAIAEALQVDISEIVTEEPILTKRKGRRVKKTPGVQTV